MVIYKVLNSGSPNPFLSVVSPIYQASDLVPQLCSALIGELSQLGFEFEIILVDDGSSDESWQEIRKACLRDKRIKGIKLTRNFGQHRAISGGLRHSTGEWVVVMDCDLQDHPQEIRNLLAKAQEGYDVVQAQRVVRQDSLIKRALSRLFYRALSYLTDTELDPSIANFGIYSRKVVRELNLLKENFCFFPLYVRWLGFSAAKLPVVHRPRPSGSSSYNFHRALQLALDVMIAFSDKPLRLMVKAGIIVSFMSLLAAAFIFFGALGGRYSSGWPSLILSVWFMGGVIIFLQGIVGIYVGKNFEEAKGRPLYVVDLALNLEREQGKVEDSFADSIQR